MDPARLVAFQQTLLAWYATHQRDLPWRRTRDPYAILVAETMLQQTQVPRVLPRYLAWLERFPTLAALAAAPTADVLREWSGLGYNSRAVRLQALARHVVAQNRGQLPTTVEELQALPGIGAYTARAIACFAYERDVPVLDTNVKRVLHRVLLGPEAPRLHLTERRLWELATQAVPTGHGYDWNQALMDLGARICTARRPACLVCPLRDCCRAAPTIQTALREQERARRRDATRTALPFTRTNRYYRGRTLRALGQLAGPACLTLDALGPQVKPDYTPDDRPWLYALVAALARDGLVSVRSVDGARAEEAAPPPGSSVREASATYDAAPAGAMGDLSPMPAAEDLNLTALLVSLPEA